MPYEKTEKRLFAIVDALLEKEPSLKVELEATDYEVGELKADLVGSADEIWEEAAEKIRHLDSLEARYRTEEKTWQEKVPVKPNPPRLPDLLGKVVTFIFGLAMIYVVGLGFYAVYRLITEGAVIFQALATLEGWFTVLFYVGPAIVAVSLFGSLEWTKDRLDARHRRRIFDYNASSEKIAREVGLRATGAEYGAVQAEVSDTIERRLKFAINALNNARRKPSYATILDIRRPRYLSEVFEQKVTIRTPARADLDFLLKRMNGGSIGIAGARGAGKSTLIRSFCGPNRAVTELNDRKLLGIMVAAPVAYQARDFLLYLFATTCQTVIEYKGGSPRLPNAAEHEDVSAAFRWMRILRPLPVPLMRAGVLLVFVGLAFAMLMAAITTLANTGSTAPSTTASAPASGNTAAPASPPAGKPVAAVPIEEQRVVTLARVWLGALKIDVGPILSWGATLLILGFILASYLGARPFRLLGSAWLSIAGGRDEERDQIAWQDAIKIDGPPESSGSQADDPVLAAAHDWLRQMKFQQSFTSGWTGSLKLPIGIEGGMNRAMTLAQNQLSVPEISAAFASFVRRLTIDYEVIIGIDELDKLESGEVAKRFINDIKSVFGLERCYYLVSVSEDAMTSFERRGLAIRDEFDSAFDELIYVDHLDFEHARQLLEQRVVGRPIPFFVLCYCLSGGLARDLIRVLRKLLECQEQSAGGPADLSFVAETMICADLIAKMRAVSAAAQKIKLEPWIDLFVAELNRVQRLIREPGETMKWAYATLSDIATLEQSTLHAAEQGDAENDPGREIQAGQSIVQKEDLPRLREFIDLSEEIATYMLFTAIVREFLCNDLDDATLKQAIQVGDIDQLAQARRMLGVNPKITRSILERFAASYDIDLSYR